MPFTQWLSVRMDDIPNPYSDDDAWDPDTADDALQAGELADLAEFSDWETYYDSLELDRLEDPADDEIKRAYLDLLLEADGDGDEERAQQKAKLLFEARYTLMAYREQYDRMIGKLGPRLGHQTFVQWRIAGEPSDVDGWIVDHKPENQSFCDVGFKEFR